MDKTNPSQEILTAIVDGMNIVIKFSSTDIYPNDITYTLDENEIYTRQDDNKEYIKINVSNMRDIKYTNPSTSGIYFEWNNDGYWESTNANLLNTYCLGRIEFELNATQDIKLDLKYTVAPYSYTAVIIGLLDTPLSQTASVDNTNKFKDINTGSGDKTAQQTIVYSSVAAGKHYIDVKYYHSYGYSYNQYKMQVKLTDDTISVKQIEGDYTDILCNLFSLDIGLSLTGIYNYNTSWNIIEDLNTNALNDDVFNATAWSQGTKLNGTLQKITDLDRQALEKRIDIWDIYYNLHTSSSNISNLFRNKPEAILPKLSGDNIVNMSGTFENCRNILNYNISTTGLNIANIEDMSNTFKDCISITNILLNSYNLQRVETFSGTFENCSNLRQLGYNTTWNMSNTKNMAHMFKNCTNLNYIPAYYWNLNNVTNMEQAFELCESLNLDVIDNIANKLPNANQLTNNMLINIGIPLAQYNAAQLYNLQNRGYVIEDYPFDPMYTVTYDLGDGEEHILMINKGANLDPSLSRVFSNIQPFANNIVNLKIAENYEKVATVTSLGSYIQNYRNLKKLDFSELNLAKMNTLWGYLKFNNNPNLIEIDFGDEQFNIANMDNMFQNCSNLRVLNWSNKVIFNSGTYQLQNTFNGCTNLNLIPGIENWNMSNVTSLNFTFRDCKNLTNLDLSNWNVGKLYSLNSTFIGCDNLVSLNLSNWNLSNLNSISAWLSCPNLEELNCSNMTINNRRTDLGSMFVYARYFRN